MSVRKFVCNVNYTRAHIGLWLLVTSHWGQIWDPWHRQMFTMAHKVIGLSLHIHFFIHLRCQTLQTFSVLPEVYLCSFVEEKIVKTAFLWDWQHFRFFWNKLVVKYFIEKKNVLSKSELLWLNIRVFKFMCSVRKCFCRVGQYGSFRGHCC